ncbi:MAG TPA: aspartate-semialdehyde dehydrogenase, partial [Bacteroidales bacterium]|nr:aspartate-semialdehyde dehydrogenase [Bacteroidales bacterium]
VALIGATGLVGQKMIQVLQERKFPITAFFPAASSASVGKKVRLNNQEYPVISIEDAIAAKPAIAIFSAGGSVSLRYAPLFAQQGTFVIDNSSAWRMYPDKKLIVPEVNGALLTKEDKIIANPNCSTIQLVMALAPLHRKYKIQRVVVSTYQSVTGTGQLAVQQLMDERKGISGFKKYPYPIDLNCFPHGGDFTENGYTTEEIKLENETRKILGDQSIAITATVVRIPVVGGHSETVNIEFEHDFELPDIMSLLNNTPGIVVQDKPEENLYPMPLTAHDKDEVFVGRIRRDFSRPNSLNMWIVSDNLRKGAATNAVQIAEMLTAKKFV